jgi:hypothetical protein
MASTDDGADDFPIVGAVGSELSLSRILRQGQLLVDLG